MFAYLYYLADSPDLRLPRYLRDVDFVLLASGAVLIAIAVGGMYDLLRDLDPTDTGARAPLASYQQSKLVMILVLTALAGLWFILLMLTMGADFPTALLIGIFMAAIFPPLHPGLFYYFLALIVRLLMPHCRLPLGLMTFMDEDADPVGLLKSVGPAYQFRHAELQDQHGSSNEFGPEGGEILEPRASPPLVAHLPVRQAPGDNDVPELAKDVLVLWYLAGWKSGSCGVLGDPPGRCWASSPGSRLACSSSPAAVAL